MATSNGPDVPPATTGRVPLRLRMSEHPGAHRLDGAWWPQGRDLAVELADLVDHFPPTSGRVSRALVSPPDWDRPPRLVPVAGRSLKVGSFPRDDTHLVILTTADRSLLHVVVVPPGLTAERAEEVMSAAVAGGSVTASELLERATTATGP